MGSVSNRLHVTKATVQDLPTWALHESINRSPQDPSFLQRYIMYDDDNESLISAIIILAPGTIITFNRATGVNQ